MTKSPFQKLFNALYLALVACLLGLSACSEADPLPDQAASEKDVSGAQQALSDVPAGENSAQLGVAKWQVGGDVVQGLNASGGVIAEFHADGESGKIIAILPEAGEKAIGDQGTGTLTERSAAYLSAALSDVDTAASGLVPDGAGEGSIQKWLHSCWYWYSDCDVRGIQGVYWGEWRGYACYRHAACSNNFVLDVW